MHKWLGLEQEFVFAFSLNKITCSHHRYFFVFMYETLYYIWNNFDPGQALFQSTARAIYGWKDNESFLTCLLTWFACLKFWLQTIEDWRMFILCTNLGRFKVFTLTFSLCSPTVTSGPCHPWDFVSSVVLSRLCVFLCCSSQIRMTSLPTFHSSTWARC